MPEWLASGEKWEWVHGGKVVGQVSQDGRWWAKFLHEWHGPFLSSDEAKRYLERHYGGMFSGPMDDAGLAMGYLHGE